MWVSAGCASGTSEQVNTHRDRTHITLHMSSGGHVIFHNISCGRGVKRRSNLTFSQAFKALWVSGGSGNGIPGQVNIERDRTQVIPNMDGVFSGGPIRLSVKRLGVLWISGGCGNGTSGQVNTQRDRTHIILHVDAVSSGGHIMFHNTSCGRGVKRRSNLTFSHAFRIF